MKYWRLRGMTYPRAPKQASVDTGSRLQSHRGQTEGGVRVHLSMLSTCTGGAFCCPPAVGAWETSAAAVHTEGPHVV